GIGGYSALPALHQKGETVAAHLNLFCLRVSRERSTSWSAPLHRRAPVGVGWSSLTPPPPGGRNREWVVPMLQAEGHRSRRPRGHRRLTVLHRYKLGAKPIRGALNNDGVPIS